MSSLRLLLLLVSLSLLSLSQARLVSRCELRDELLKVVQLPQNLRRNPERAMARVICEVERFSHLSTHFLREYYREIINLGDTTTTTSEQPPTTTTTTTTTSTFAPPTTPPPRPPTTTTTPELPPTTTTTTEPTPYPEIPETSTTTTTTTTSTFAPPTTPPPRPPTTTTTPELPPTTTTTTEPTPYPEIPETSTTTTATTTSTFAPPTTPPPRPPTTTTTTTTDIISGDSPAVNTSLARERRAVREKRASISVVSVRYFGIFQFSDLKYCNSGYSYSENRCKSDCYAFIDDDITDDVECFVESRRFWEVYRRAVRSCRSTRTLDSFFDACDAGEELDPEEQLLFWYSISS